MKNVMLFVSMILLCVPFVFAADNTCTSAASRNFDTSYKEYIEVLGDIDWSKWYVPSAGLLRIDVNVPSGKDYDLVVYSSCSESECLSVHGTGADEYCVIEVEPGYYYSKVWGGGDTSAHYSATAAYYVEGSLEVAYTPSYDLYVKSITPPPSMVAGVPFNIDYVVRNSGLDSISTSFSTIMYIDDAAVTGHVPRSSLGAGSDAAFTKASVSLSAGTHTVRVVTDSQSTISETNEGNNEKTITITVQPPALPQYNLYVKSITPPPSMVAGVPFNIDYVVRNSGLDSISTSFSTIMYIDDAAVTGHVPRSSLGAGSDAAFTKASVSLSQGNHTISVFTDSEYQISETNEGNNGKTITVTVQPPADPCAGVDCSDGCDGTTLQSDGYCSAGECYYNNIEPFSTDCGYDSCAFMLCEDNCTGTTRYISTGCSAGVCQYSAQQDSPECAAVDPCESVDKADHCEGNVFNFDGVCVDGDVTFSQLNCAYGCVITGCVEEPVEPLDCADDCVGTTFFGDGYDFGGICVYATIEEKSSDCGYVLPEYSGIIVLDAGHYPGIAEYDLNDAVVSSLVTVLEADGFTVYRTNSSMTFSERGNLADDLGADVLLSVHFNVFGGTTTGSEAFYYDADDMAFCEYILPPVVGILPSNDRGVKPDTATLPGELTILRSRDGVACLVEPEAHDALVSVTFDGVMYDNYWDLISSDDYVAALTEALREGIHAYYDADMCVEGCAEPDPCTGEDTSNYCSGNTLNFNGVCSAGVVSYSHLTCAYGCQAGACLTAPPLVCSDMCIGTTRYYSGFPDGSICAYLGEQKNSTLCGWVNTTVPHVPAANVVIESVSVSPSQVSCEGSRNIVLRVALANYGDAVASNVIVEYNSSGLETARFTLPFSIGVNSAWSRDFTISVPSYAAIGVNKMDVIVIYGGKTISRSIDVKVQACTDYFIDNIDSIPDVYQYSDVLNLDQEGAYHCGTSSATNVLVWLYTLGFSNLSSGTEDQAIHSTMHALSGENYTNVDAANGVWPAQLMTNISEYVWDKGYNVSSMQFQGWRVKDVKPEYNTNVTVPDIDWIKEGTRYYSGMLLHLGWYNYIASTDTYVRNSGHWVTVVGYGMDGEGNVDPAFLILHDSATSGSERNVYVNMTEITAGKFPGDGDMPSSAEGYYIADGIALPDYREYGIVEAAVRFNVVEREPVETPSQQPAAQPAASTSSGSGGSGGGSSHVSSTVSSTASTTYSVVSVPVSAPVNPALSVVTSPKTKTVAVQPVQIQAVTPVVGEPAVQEETVPVVTAAPLVTAAVVTEIPSECDSDADCGQGNVCLPDGFFARLFDDPVCCPAGSEFVDGACVQPELASWNEHCDDETACASGLSCISTANWWNIFSQDRGVCCVSGDHLLGDGCSIIVSKHGGH